jgi:hypothetical protein
MPSEKKVSGFSSMSANGMPKEQKKATVLNAKLKGYEFR